MRIENLSQKSNVAQKKTNDSQVEQKLLFNICFKKNTFIEEFGQTVKQTNRVFSFSFNYKL